VRALRRDVGASGMRGFLRRRNVAVDVRVARRSALRRRRQRFGSMAGIRRLRSRGNLVSCSPGGEFVGRGRTRIAKFGHAASNRFEPGFLMTGVHEKQNAPIPKQENDARLRLTHRARRSAPVPRLTWLRRPARRHRSRRLSTLAMHVAYLMRFVRERALRPARWKRTGRFCRHGIHHPPSTAIVCPAMNDASGPQRNERTEATSWRGRAA
jgi:hypothetical protein